MREGFAAVLLHQTVSMRPVVDSCGVQRRRVTNRCSAQQLLLLPGCWSAGTAVALAVACLAAPSGARAESDHVAELPGEHAQKAHQRPSHQETSNHRAVPEELAGVRVDERLGSKLPLEATFTDHRGRQVQLRDLVSDKPVLLNLIYHSCPTLCNLVLDATSKVIKPLDWSIGKEYEAIALSIDPRDTPASARDKREQMLGRYRRSSAKAGWTFLVGEQSQIRKVTDAVGFKYRWDAKQEQFAHPAALILLTPEGRVARYVYGIDFKVNDVRLGLLEASRGNTVSTVEKLLLYCYHFDPEDKGYVLAATNVMRLGGALTAIILGLVLGTYWWRERRRVLERRNQLGTTAEDVV